MSNVIEYRVRPITRYIVTRFEGYTDDRTTESAGRSTQHGTFENGETAYHVAYALCRAEHEKAGTPPDDPAFQYPPIPDGVTVQPI